MKVNIVIFIFVYKVKGQKRTMLSTNISVNGK